MLLHLGAKLGESHLDAREDVRSISRGVQRARRQGEMDSENVAFLSRMLFDVRVELHEVGRIAFEELVQLGALAEHFFFDWLAPVFVGVANGDFHGKAFPIGFGRGAAMRGSIRESTGKFRITIWALGCK
jgi:hypothetical protein